MTGLQHRIQNLVSKTVKTGNHLAIWGFKALSYLFELALFFAGTVLVCHVFYAAARYMWMGYVDTYLGRQFAGFFSARAYEINRLLGSDLLALSLDLSLTSLKTCLLIALCLRLTSLDRYLYIHRDPVYRFLIWGGICTGLVSFFLGERLQAGWATALASGLLVTLPLFQACFRIVSELLPELGVALSWSLSGPAGYNTRHGGPSSRKKEPLEIHNMTVKKGRSAQAVYLDFILRNTSPGLGPVSGYVAVVLTSGRPDLAGLVYPAEARLKNGEVERFYEGRPFKAHGFVRISAMVRLPDPDFRVGGLIVYIFSPDGELLLKTRPDRWGAR